MENIRSIADKIDKNENVIPLIDNMLDHILNLDLPKDRLQYVFLKCFRARINKENIHASNLYSVSGPNDMLSAFKVLTEKTPLIRFGYECANRIIKDTGYIHIIDIGIGNATQWYYYMDLIKSDPPKHLRLTGIDLSYSIDEPYKHLNAIGKSLSKYARNLNIPFTFYPIVSNAETLDFNTVERDPNETLVINATLALHHIPSNIITDEDNLEMLLTKLYNMKPHFLTITEPDSNHNSSSFVPRVDNALKHYGAIFNALHMLLDNDDRAIIESMFFNKEIYNVVAMEGIDRIERHEHHDIWRQRLTNAGFNLYPPIDRNMLSDVLNLNDKFEITNDNDILTLNFDGTSLVSSSVWTTSK